MESTRRDEESHLWSVAKDQSQVKRNFWFGLATLQGDAIIAVRCNMQCCKIILESIRKELDIARNVRTVCINRVNK